MGPAEWGILIALSILWGGSFFFLEIMLRAWPPFTVVLARVGFGALVLWAFMLATGRAMPRDWRIWRAFAIVAFLGNALPFVLFAFMMPLGSLTGVVTFPLRILVTNLAVFLGKFALGADVMAVGTQLINPSMQYQYEIAVPCSG